MNIRPYLAASAALCIFMCIGVARADVIFSTRDTIFDSSMDPKHKAPSDNDHLFRGSFSDG